MLPVPVFSLPSAKSFAPSASPDLGFAAGRGVSKKKKVNPELTIFKERSGKIIKVMEGALFYNN